MLYAHKPIVIQWTDPKGTRWVRLFWRSQYSGEWLRGSPIWGGMRRGE